MPTPDPDGEKGSFQVHLVKFKVCQSRLTLSFCCTQRHHGEVQARAGPAAPVVADPAVPAADRGRRAQTIAAEKLQRSAMELWQGGEATRCYREAVPQSST